VRGLQNFDRQRPTIAAGSSECPKFSKFTSLLEFLGRQRGEPWLAERVRAVCAAYNAQTPPPARAVDADAAAARLGAGPPASQGMFAGCASLPGKHCASFFDAEVQALLADQGVRSRSLQAAVDGAAGRGAARKRRAPGGGDDAGAGAGGGAGAGAKRQKLAAASKN